MTVIEKLENNIAEVNSSFQAIKSKIVSHGVEVADELRPSEYAPKVDAVYEAGKKAEYDAFWDALQENGKRTIYNRGFSGKSWNDKTFFPKYDIKPSYGIVGTFLDCGVTDLEARLRECGVVLDTSGNANYSQTFASGRFTVLPEIVFSGFTSNVYATFQNCAVLHTIRKIILREGFNAFMTDSFTNCTALENVVFEGIIPKAINVQWCPLTHDSLMSIINALKDYSGTDTWTTITLGAENIAKLTSDELLIAEQKQWQIS